METQSGCAEALGCEGVGLLGEGFCADRVAAATKTAKHSTLRIKAPPKNRPQAGAVRGVESDSPDAGHVLVSDCFSSAVFLDPYPDREPGEGTTDPEARRSHPDAGPMPARDARSRWPLLLDCLRHTCQACPRAEALPRESKA